MIRLDCYYSLSSPWAYLAGPKLQDIVRRHRAHLTLKPFDFQAVVPKTGGVPLRTRPEPRRRYHEAELDRWRRHLGMPLVLKPKHYPQELPADPNWNKYAGWMVIAAQSAGLDALPLSQAILRALWAEQRDISKPRCAGPSRRRTAMMGHDCSQPRRVSRCNSSIVSSRSRPNSSAGSVRRPVSSTATYSGGKTGSILSIASSTACVRRGNDHKAGRLWPGLTIKPVSIDISSLRDCIGGDQG